MLIAALVCFTLLTEEEKEKETQIHNVSTIMYTCDTSGDPKGVVLTHETISYSVKRIDLFLEQFEDKVSSIIELVIDSLYTILTNFLSIFLIFPFVCFV